MVLPILSMVSMPSLKCESPKLTIYYETIIPTGLSDDERNVMRQSLAGLLWSKQFYHYVIKDWLDGDPKQPPPSPARYTGRNSRWDPPLQR